MANFSIGNLVLEEEIDENFEPNEEGVVFLIRY